MSIIPWSWHQFPPGRTLAAQAISGSIGYHDITDRPYADLPKVLHPRHDRPDIRYQDRGWVPGRTRSPVRLL